MSARDRRSAGPLITSDIKESAGLVLDQIRELIQHPDTDDLGYVRLTVREAFKDLIEALS